MGTPIRVLVADDSELIRRAVCGLLQAQPGIAVCGEAANYAELLKKFNATTTDVVLMDLRMPGENLLTPATIKNHLHGSCWLAMSAWNDAVSASLAEPQRKSSPKHFASTPVTQQARNMPITSVLRTTALENWATRSFGLNKPRVLIRNAQSLSLIWAMFA